MAEGKKKTATAVGMFLFLGLFLLGVMILLFGNIQKLFQERYEVKVYFREASGLIKGSTVRLRGAKVGEVARKPSLTDDSRVEVVLAIDSGIQIEKASTFQVGQASLLGDKEVVITPPLQSSGIFLIPGAEVMGSDPGGLEMLQNEAGDIVLDVRGLLQDSKQVLAKIDASISEIETLVKSMERSMTKVNEGLLSDENLGNIRGTLANLERASGSFATVGEELDPTLRDFRFAINELRETNQVVKSTVKSLDPTLEGLPQVMASIEQTAQKASATMEKIDQSEGILGALVSDEEMKTDMKDFVRNLKEKGVLRYKDEGEKEEDPRDRFRGRRR